MKYKSKLRVDKKYIEYLDEEHRSHVLLDEKLIEKVKNFNLVEDRWYNINIIQNKEIIKEIKLENVK